MDVAHTFERATSGRARCRGCGRSIEKGDLRFGERLPNPYAEGEMTVWYHPRCAAYGRPEALLETLDSAEMGAEERSDLEAAARWSCGHRRLPRIHGAERAPTGQAKCRSCRQPIARGAWRVRLRFLEEGRPQPGGFIHLECRQAYFETGDIADAVLHFSPDLDEDSRAELIRALA